MTFEVKMWVYRVEMWLKSVWFDLDSRASVHKIQQFLLGPGLGVEQALRISAKRSLLSFLKYGGVRRDPDSIGTRGSGGKCSFPQGVIPTCREKRDEKERFRLPDLPAGRPGGEALVECGSASQGFQL